MYGWHGKILRINLALGKTSAEPLEPGLAEKFLGGRGMGVKILYEELKQKTDPCSHENKLIFATGPLTGTLAPTSGRYAVVSKSPLTQTIFDSNSGGFFGPELKFTGNDILIIEGRAEHPVYIWINNDHTEILDATKLWGLDTQKTTDKLLKKTDPKAKVACIGPAGEKLVKISCIINDKHRAAGRGGLGAVMGSKNLKAVVVKGNKKPQLAKPTEFKEQVKKSIQVIKKNPITKKALPTLGTAVLVNIINELGLFPTCNFQKGLFNDAEGISGEKITERFLVGQYACFACPIGCGRKTKTLAKSGFGPEYETVWAYGAQCGVKDLEAVTTANYLCNELGLDTISTGSTIACAMELFEKGYIKAGEKLEFGNSELICKLTEQIGYKKGLGAQLSEGSYRLAERYGHPELSMSVKKLELPAYDPRGLQGMGLAYATSNRGGCHLRAYLVSPEVLGAPCLVDRFKPEGKPELVILMQNIYAVLDSAIFCKFSSFALNPAHYAQLLSSATGLNILPSDLFTIGERIWNLERLFNNREGFTRKDDTLPTRLTKVPLKEGHSKGRLVELEPMLNEYYKLRGWNEQGVPLKNKLQELGLG